MGYIVHARVGLEITVNFFDAEVGKQNIYSQNLHTIRTFILRMFES